MFSEVISNLKTAFKYISNLVKWLFFSLVIGIACGFAGSFFHHAVDEAAHLREHFPFILYFLPVAGILIVFIYHFCHMDNDKGTNAIIGAVRSENKVSILLAPVILVATTLTHLCGGSSGREGAALQIGGSIGSFIGSIFKTGKHDLSVFVMCGMSGLFAAVFGTPLAAAVFSLEVVSVGIMHYSALFPCIMSAFVANSIANKLGIANTCFSVATIPAIDYFIVGKIILLALMVSVISILFISLMHTSSSLMQKYLKNKYLRIITGAILIIILTAIVGNYNYNGAGMEIIVNAVEKGQADPFAFLIKILFTAITLSAGFKGGEIIPTFYIGSTFGVFIAPLLGINPSFAAAVALIAMFCGVVNCPVASLLLGIELFGIEGVLFYGIAIAVSYIVSGNYSLYTSQKIIYSKLDSVLSCDNDGWVV